MSRKRTNNKRFSKLKRNFMEAVKRQTKRDFMLLSMNDINHTCLLMPPLSITDTLFIKREETENLIEHSTNDEIYMQNGYASAAITMLKLIMMSKDWLFRESYINPVMFCFRQYLELSMKDSLVRFRFMRKKANIDEVSLNGHDLYKLWGGLKKCIDTEDNTVKCIGSLVKELNDVDKNGTLFRYNAFLTKNICDEERKMPLIDVDNLYNRILQMYNFFEGVNELARNGQDEMTANNYE